MTTIIKHSHYRDDNHLWIEMKEITRPNNNQPLDRELRDVPLDAIKTVSDVINKKSTKFRFPITWIKH